MNVSFIITTFNIEPYIKRCLESVIAVAQPDDEIIVVDDGSTDLTQNIIKESLKSSNRSDRIDVKTIFLGENTIGGVGIAGNIGMDNATKECIFFVDGDDWLDEEGFRYARGKFSKRKTDILIANYKEYDEVKDKYRAPADEARWCRLSSGAEAETRQLQALGLIAVPWRKFYKRDFIEQHKLRFPEGDFFFEDNPFHWNVCLNTDRIAFVDVTLCYHRVNRPGQTMASTGAELIAFFEHYETIVSYFTSETPEAFHEQARSWMLGNMSWHLARLQPEAAPRYFQKAEKVFSVIAEHELPKSFANTEVSLYAVLLKEKGWTAALDYFLAKHNRKELQFIHSAISEVKNRIIEQLRPIRGSVVALRNTTYYDVLYDEFHSKHMQKGD